MTPKKIALSALVAAVLAGAAALLFWLQKPTEPSQPLAKLRAGDLSRIELDHNGAHVALEMRAGTWRLTSRSKTTRTTAPLTASPGACAASL